MDENLALKSFLIGVVAAVNNLPIVEYEGRAAVDRELLLNTLGRFFEYIDPHHYG